MVRKKASFGPQKRFWAKKKRTRGYTLKDYGYIKKGPRAGYDRRKQTREKAYYNQHVPIRINQRLDQLLPNIGAKRLRAGYSGSIYSQAGIPALFQWERLFPEAAAVRSYVMSKAAGNGWGRW